MLQPEEALGTEPASPPRRQGGEAASASVAAPGRATDGPRAQDRQDRSLVLVDALSLRRASTLELLHLHLREPVFGVAGAVDLLAGARALQGRLSCIVLAVGGRSLAEAEISGQVRQLCRAFPTVPTAVLSDHETIDEVVAAFRHGARGLVPTSLEPAVAIEALRLVRAGGAYFPAGALSGGDPSRRWRPAAAPRQESERWPPRQLAVLRLVTQGKANKEIARALRMEESTVKVHVWHIMRKLDATNRTQAALRARELGILDQEERHEAADDKAASPGAMVA
jgi:DNA-binding NarL/FixJ family response regulator